MGSLIGCVLALCADSDLEPEKSAATLDAFDLASEEYYPPATKEDFERSVRAFDPSKPLDRAGKALLRGEQGFLRSQLFGRRRVADCGICGERYPIGFLVTAHIEKRARCSTTEKLDFEHIVMPMCSFGCDSLYERGFITVVDGKVEARGLKRLTDAARQHAVRVAGRNCKHWNEGSKPYFDWHARNAAQTE